MTQLSAEDAKAISDIANETTLNTVLMQIEAAAATGVYVLTIPIVDSLILSSLQSLGYTYSVSSPYDQENFRYTIYWGA